MSALPRRALIQTHPRRGEGTGSASRIGSGLTIVGELETQGELHVHGRVHGTVRADRVVLAAEGEVDGDIVARDVRICGRLTGRVFAVNVMLDSTAHIKGRVFHHAVEVARGARVDARMPWRPINFFETLDQLPETQP